MRAVAAVTVQFFSLRASATLNERLCMNIDSRAVVTVIVIAFLSSEHYFIIGFYFYFYSYGLLLKVND